MTKVLCLALMTQVLLILAGLSLLQLISYRKKIQITYCIPYAWGIGLLFLYASGNIFFRLGLLVRSWHFIVFAIILLLML
ncbi:MAG: hypothetical protein JRJ14_07650, partial [Deltaproteobacteria bacterium]|nr:hypothetical protein [Deltaproteobacteria bacterium]